MKPNCRHLLFTVMYEFVLGGRDFGSDVVRIREGRYHSGFSFWMKEKKKKGRNIVRILTVHEELSNFLDIQTEAGKLSHWRFFLGFYLLVWFNLLNFIGHQQLMPDFLFGCSTVPFRPVRLYKQILIGQVKFDSSGLASAKLSKR